AVRLTTAARLLPYTTLFRSQADGCLERSGGGRCVWHTHGGNRRRVGNSPLWTGADHLRTGARQRATGHNRGLAAVAGAGILSPRSEEHTSELQSRENLVCRL